MNVDAKLIAMAFRTALAGLWVCGCIGAALYARHQHIPSSLAAPLAFAYLVELTFYFAMGRNWFPEPERLAVSAMLSYLVATVPAGTFAWSNLLILVFLAAAASFWLPKLPRLDYLFLGLIAAVLITPILKTIYADPSPDLKIVSPLGKLMWFRIGVSAILQYRPSGHLAFGWIPRMRDWTAGARYFLYFLPAAALVNYAVHFTEFRVAQGYWWKAPVTFAAVLWGLALAEEVFCRGMLLQRLSASLGWAPALVLSSAIFGSVHLWYRDFPNWKFAVMAAAAGVFYAHAYRDSGGVRGAMVTHALAVTTWKTLFT